MARNMNMHNLILPPGFKFNPTDEELINHYLKKKISSSLNPQFSVIADINIYMFNPWELPRQALYGESEWFFFSPRDRKYPNGARPNRTTPSGYWKATGSDKSILTSNGSQCLGMKKALVFYKGRAPTGTKTNWIMLEYRLLNDLHHLRKPSGSMRLDDWVLCRVHQKNNNPKQQGKTYDSSSSSRSGMSSSFSPEFLQVQEMTMNKNTTQANCDTRFRADGQSMDQSNNPQPDSVSALREALESIKKVLSIGAFEEELITMPVVPPEKRLYNAFSAAKDSENASVFQLSSPTTISTTYPESFSELFMI